MKTTIILLAFCMIVGISFSQEYVTRTAHLNIKSTNSVQNIAADNYQVACQLNAQTGQFKIIALIKSFEYQIGAMNRMMNTRDIDVTEFPKITYNGKIANLNKVNFAKPGSYPVKVDGILYIWNEKRITSAEIILTVLADGSIDGKSNFAIEIEEASTKKIDAIIRQKLPANMNLSSSSLGISKIIQVKTDAILKKR